MRKMWPRETSARLAGCLCVLLAIVSSDPEVKVYRKVGDEVVLRPGNSSVTGTITGIIWKHGGDIAAEWDGTEVDRYRQFAERSILNITNGELKITGLTQNETGLYTSEINNEIKTPDLRLILISPVPKPTVSQSCDAEGTSCTLTCDGDTADAGPVTYRWRQGDKETAGSRELRITKEGSEGVKEFSCELQNPVSEESSGPILNPLVTAPIAAPTAAPPAGQLKISTGVTVFVGLLVGLLLLVGVHRCKAGMWFFQKTSMPWESNFWRKNERPPTDAAESNGTPTQEKGYTDEETPFSRAEK